MASILIGDEVEILRAQLDEILTEAGHRVRLAKTFAEAIEQAQHRQFDALLLDVVCIPNSSIEELKGFPPDLPIILTATRAQHKQLFTILERRPDLNYIEKPFKKSEVLASFARILHSPAPMHFTPTDNRKSSVDLHQTVASLAESEKLGASIAATDIARLPMTLERVSEARSNFLRCSQQQEKSSRISCDEFHRMLEHARADLETQLNDYIDTRVRAVLANSEFVRSGGLIEYIGASQNRDFPNPPTSDLSQGVDLEEEITRYEIDLIRRALELTGGHQSRAARILRMNPTTLNSKIKKCGI